RALSSLPSLLELASPLLQQGGYLICYKAKISDEDIAAVKPLKAQLAMRFISRRDFLLSDGITERCILVFEKKGYPSVALPRRSGMAQKHPYIV
ncbi:MAG: 16S rRNA (guanine(527)-N(7))-methyltransferase RsmG, partial [Raoultibacter sp.]